jgi:hypothetical protein
MTILVVAARRARHRRSTSTGEFVRERCEAVVPFYTRHRPEIGVEHHFQMIVVVSPPMVNRL